MNGIKHDDKARTDLIPVRPLMALANVYRSGAEKYEERNWEKGMKFSLLYRALLRHLFAFWDGEDFDPEDGQHHLDSVAFHTFALREYVERGIGEDDRPHRQRERSAYRQAKQTELILETQAHATKSVMNELISRVIDIERGFQAKDNYDAPTQIRNVENRTLLRILAIRDNGGRKVNRRVKQAHLDALKERRKLGERRAN